MSRAMTLSPGSRLGPYEVLSPAGAGGMGEVYRARDTRLSRVVALKILPSHLSEKPAARERFEREARAISSLNHPSICHLYDVGSQDGIHYLVMEFLEGETLADRLRRGPMPTAQVLSFALDICEGLDRAHRAGIVHRDLKPGNIMITRTGARLMDFGLARPSVPTGDPGATGLETISNPLTAEGTLVGTIQYMSPEQVEGKEVDARSDIFALGAVLYEMLTGRRAFEGRSQISVASAILEKEPEPISALRPMTPPALELAIRTCLAKEPEARWQSARDLAHALRWAAGTGGQAAERDAGAGGRRIPRWAHLAGWLAAAAASLALVVQVAWLDAPATPVIRTHIRPMPGTSFLLSDAAGFALSPDGRTLAYVGSTPEGKALLWVRPLDSFRAEPLAGTDGARHPFWSPDCRFLGFFGGGKLRIVEATGGAPLTLSDAPDGRGGTWNGQGEILFAPAVNSAIHRISASGGPAVPVTRLDTSRLEISHRWPVFLPDGRHFLYLAGSVFTSVESPTNLIVAGSLDSEQTRVLLRSHAGASFASGRLLFMRAATLLAQPLDVDRLELTGRAAPIADPVREISIFSSGLFSASGTGLLAFVEGSASFNRQLVWYDRSGRRTGMVAGEDGYASPRLSPDGGRILYYLDSGAYDVWTLDLARGVRSPQTFGTSTGEGNLFPSWSPDGQSIVYTSIRDGKYVLKRKAADGASQAEPLLEGVERYRFASDWSPDGRTIAYHEGTPGGWKVWVLPLTGERKPRLFIDSPFSLRDASFSPDGRWLAFCSNESGEYKVYVAPFPGPGGKWQISREGGFVPRWRRDGRELFYYSADNRIMAAEVSATASRFEVGQVRPLFETRAYGVFGRFDVSADGQKFLVPVEEGEPSTAIALVAGWPAGLPH